MSASKIKVDTHTVTQAGVDMGVAANTTSEVLGQVAAVSQDPTAAAAFGEPHLSAVFDNFWTGLRQQVQLSGDVFGELGKKMGGAAVKLNNSDTNSANGMGNANPGATAPAPATTPSVAPPGADNNPPPVTSSPPPAAPTTPTDPTNGGGDANGGTISAPGSASGTDTTTQTTSQTATTSAPGV